MHANGAIDSMPRCLEGPSCCGALFQIEATYAHLLDILGEPDTIEDVAPMWVIRVRSEDDRSAERVAVHSNDNRLRTAGDDPALWYVTTYRDSRWAADRIAQRLGKVVELTR